MNDFDDGIDLAPPVQRTVPAAGAPLPWAVHVNGPGIWGGLMRDLQNAPKPPQWRHEWGLQKKVVALIRACGPMTNPELAAACSRTPRQIGAAVAHLLKAGVLRRVSPQRTRPRPPLELCELDFENRRKT